MPPPPPRDRVEWTSASDLAEYAYCPRAHYYRHHPTDAGPDPAAVRRSTAGSRYHGRRLAQMDRLESGHAAAWWIVGACLLLVLAGVVGVWG